MDSFHQTSNLGSLVNSSVTVLHEIFHHCVATDMPLDVRVKVVATLFSGILQLGKFLFNHTSHVVRVVRSEVIILQGLVRSASVLLPNKRLNEGPVVSRTEHLTHECPDLLVVHVVALKVRLHYRGTGSTCVFPMGASCDEFLHRGIVVRDWIVCRGDNINLLTDDVSQRYTSVFTTHCAKEVFHGFKSTRPVLVKVLSRRRILRFDVLAVLLNIVLPALDFAGANTTSRSVEIRANGNTGAVLALTNTVRPVLESWDGKVADSNPVVANDNGSSKSSCIRFASGLLHVIHKLFDLLVGKIGQA